MESVLDAVVCEWMLLLFICTGEAINERLVQVQAHEKHQVYTLLIKRKKEYTNTFDTMATQNTQFEKFVIGTIQHGFKTHTSITNETNI